MEHSKYRGYVWLERKSPLKKIKIQVLKNDRYKKPNQNKKQPKKEGKPHLKSSKWLYFCQPKQFVKSGVKETVSGKMPLRWFLHVRVFIDPAFYQNDGVIQGHGFFAWSPVLARHCLSD